MVGLRVRSHVDPPSLSHVTKDLLWWVTQPSPVRPQECGAGNYPPVLNQVSTSLHFTFYLYILPPAYAEV